MNQPPTESIVALARELVRIPTRAGTDDYAPVFSRLRRWLEQHRVPFRLIEQAGAPLALVIEIGDPAVPAYLLNATIDTVGFGNEEAWSLPPTSAEIVDGWLHGRGSADSKAAVAIFCHLAAELAARPMPPTGRLQVLFDADEHTGRFGGLRAYLGGSPRLAGALLGYPGMDAVAAGSRGFARAVLSVHGRGAHSGSGSNAGRNAVERAARLVVALSAAELPGATGRFPLPPKLTVTHIHGGEGFSVVPDLCRIGVDLRLTPEHGQEWAHAFLGRVVERFDGEAPDLPPTRIMECGSWPAYQLSEDSEVLRALSEAAAATLGAPVPHVVVGPSNVGNLLYQSGIEATCGFGVRYRNLHGTDEAIEIATIGPVHAVYARAIERLLQPGR